MFYKCVTQEETTLARHPLRPAQSLYDNLLMDAYLVEGCRACSTVSTASMLNHPHH